MRIPTAEIVQKRIDPDFEARHAIRRLVMQRREDSFAGIHDYPLSFAVLP
ncbi:MAG: hypothetical protein JXA10_09350 [Anaerolineae bacterium]|nr:hypothetical protein [Anaerolineae bacterium]